MLRDLHAPGLLLALVSGNPVLRGARHPLGPATVTLIPTIPLPNSIRCLPANLILVFLRVAILAARHLVHLTALAALRLAWAMAFGVKCQNLDL